MNILLDMDGVLADFFTSALERLNKALGKNITAKEYVEKFSDFDMAKYYGISYTKFWEIIEEGNNFWTNISPYPWANKLLAALRERGDVTICTTPSLNPDCPRQKLEWLEKHLSIKSIDVMIGGKKELMSRTGNILIDDYPKNVDKFNRDPYSGMAILAPSNWNTLNLNYDLVWSKILDKYEKM